MGRGFHLRDGAIATDDVGMVGERRSLNQFGGRIETAGEPALAALLETAWRAADGDAVDLTHAFHAYPARAHPALVRVLVRELSQPGELVVDPFCGSGTTLVEACAAGRRAFGGDVNGVAVPLAWQKTRRTTAAWRAQLVAAAGRIAARGIAAARNRDASTPASVPAELRAWFAPQVWRELDALGRAIDGERDAARHLALLLILSSLLTKVSRREAETSEKAVERRLATGFTSRLFSDRADELVKGLAALAAAASASRRPPPLVALCDARALPLRSGAAALVVTSPPYAGTYDYARIQELRARLLGIRLDAAKRREIGARDGDARDPERTLAAFKKAFGEALAEMARVLAPGGRAVLILGDSRLGRRALRSDALVRELAGGSGLRVAASASQERPEPRPLGGGKGEDADGPRREHLLLLVPESRHGETSR
jgi:SAM-dependent methyltransferase